MLYPNKPYPKSPTHSKYKTQIDELINLFIKERNSGFPHCTPVDCDGNNDMKITLCIQRENLIKLWDSGPKVDTAKYVTYIPSKPELWDNRVNLCREKVTDEDVFKKVAEQVIRMFANRNNGRCAYKAMAIWIDGDESDPVLFD